MLPPLLLVQYGWCLCSIKHCLISTSCKVITHGVKSLPNIYKHFLKETPGTPMHLILEKQLVQNSGDCIISVSLSLGQDWSRFPMERRGRCGLGAALVSSRSLVLLYQQCNCPEKGRWPNLVSAGCILQWWQTELEKRVRDTQKGEVLHFRGCCGEGKQTSYAIAFSSKMKAI